MASLVIRDGVHAPHVDILLKQILPSIGTGALVRPLHPTCPLTCAWSSWVWLIEKTLMHSVRMDIQVCGGGHVHQLAKVHV